MNSADLVGLFTIVVSVGIALLGGMWLLATKLTRIEDRLTSLESKGLQAVQRRENVDIRRGRSHH